MVNETKLTSSNAFILDLRALLGDKKSKYDEQTLFGSSFRNFTGLLTLSLQKALIRVFPDSFNFRQFWHLPLIFIH